MSGTCAKCGKHSENVYKLIFEKTEISDLVDFGRRTNG